MLRAIWDGARKLCSNLSGNVAVIVAVGMPALIGAAGLAIDVAQWYTWKREVQHSVDQAALGGAWALSNPDSKDNYQTRAKQEFDANQAITKDFTSPPTITLAGYAGGTDNSVLVTATASKQLPFSGFLMGSAVQILVKAQASFAPGGNYHACLTATSETGTGLDIGGNADVRAQCGLAALSCDDNAIQIDGSAKVLTDSIATCGTADVPDENQDVVTEKVTVLKDPLAGLNPPDNPTKGDDYSCKGVGKGAKATTQATISAGTYTGGITIKCTTVLNPGIYVIDGGVLDLTANYNVTGTNVMFVLKNGAKIKFGGNGNDNKVTLSPMQESDFAGGAYAANASDYAGILVFEDRNNNPANPGHELNGNSKSLIEGQIYLPSGEMTVLGTAKVAAQCLQITATKIHIKGNAFLETLCPTDETNAVGSSDAKIRLVA
ncbi:MAG TPA: TadE/TadG family type IV pilus assembly protein [Novosphingobium sp.]|nr:TadE/TadG family type IV pilus assembly protein [Novosphingobium sp.]